MSPRTPQKTRDGYGVVMVVDESSWLRSRGNRLARRGGSMRLHRGVRSRRVGNSTRGRSQGLHFVCRRSAIIRGIGQIVRRDGDSTPEFLLKTRVIV